MGSGDWLKNIIRKKRVKDDKSKKAKESSASEKSNGFKPENVSHKESGTLIKSASNGNPGVPGMLVEDVAATRIQTAFRAYLARKTLRRMKGSVRLQTLTQSQSVRKQALTTLSYLHSWSRIQAQIRDRRMYMVTQGLIKQKKIENQLKLEAKLHDLEVEWNGGSETMDEALAKIHQREEAALKRERAMAYAFTHQWRANSTTHVGPGTYELGKANWGWSWMERWIAVRPWESQVPPQRSPKKSYSRQGSKTGKNIKSPSMKTSSSTKLISPNGKGTTKARILSLGMAEAEKPAVQEGDLIDGSNAKKVQVVSS